MSERELKRWTGREAKHISGLAVMEWCKSSDVAELEQKLEEAKRLLEGAQYLLNEADIGSDGIDFFLESIKDGKE